MGWDDSLIVYKRYYVPSRALTGGVGGASEEYTHRGAVAAKPRVITPSPPRPQDGLSLRTLVGFMACNWLYGVRTYC